MIACIYKHTILLRLILLRWQDRFSWDQLIAWNIISARPMSKQMMTHFVITYAHHQVSIVWRSCHKSYRVAYMTLAIRVAMHLIKFSNLFCFTFQILKSFTLSNTASKLHITDLGRLVSLSENSANSGYYRETHITYDCIICIHFHAMSFL